MISWFVVVNWLRLVISSARFGVFVVIIAAAGGRRIVADFGDNIFLATPFYNEVVKVMRGNI